MIHKSLSDPLLLAAFGVALIVVSIALRILVLPGTDRPQN
jgi:hypothetical protein